MNFHNCWLKKRSFPYPSTVREAAEAELSNLGVPFKIYINGNGDGFTISKNGNEYQISGGETGALYAAFRLGVLLNNKTDFTQINEAPSYENRIINHWDNFNGNIERGYSGKSLFFDDNEIDYDENRMRHYARMLASVGLNAVAINNVNVSLPAVKLITGEKLPRLAKLAEIFKPYGVRLILSINYASPVMLGELDTADPCDPRVADWWKKRFDIIYSYIPNLLGVLVKADSENQPGPFSYGRDHADGANLFAKALAPHGGYVFWRCFVYNCKQNWRDTKTDRPKFPYDNFMPLDGRFDENVVLQIKNGPYDFQIREPVSPLLGAMKQTTQAVEFQIAQEYTGQQIDLCFLPTLWREVLDTGFKVKHIAAVTNTGNDFNWTGNYLAAANLYGYGRLAWDSSLSPESIAAEWCGLMFEDADARAAVKKMLLDSREIYENYTTPLGMGWFVTPHTHYGPDPLGYEFSLWGTYHRADREAVGIDRSSRGTGYTRQYPPEVAAVYDNIDTCPEELLLFFHRVAYNHVLKNGKTLIQYLYDSHFKGAEGAERLLKAWEALEGRVPGEIYKNVLERLHKQVKNAYEWRDVFNTFFYRLTGESDGLGRLIYK